MNNKRTCCPTALRRHIPQLSTLPSISCFAWGRVRQYPHHDNYALQRYAILPLSGQLLSYQSKRPEAFSSSAKTGCRFGSFGSTTYFTSRQSVPPMFIGYFLDAFILKARVAPAFPHSACTTTSLHSSYNYPLQ